ncbi:uncharacterized protein METZ01_LOCUS107013 [marine metagenome]|uniref:Cell division protein FtsX n=1 Tax=marine metagenome TaxID=408172 RepID=A0A381WNP5_9ZZZZ
MTISVIAIALALPAGLRVFLTNAELLSDTWEGTADLSVYLKMDVDEFEARRLAVEVESRNDVSQVQLISSNQALEEFRTYSGLGAALEALEENPLPHSLVVKPAGGIEGNVEELVNTLESLAQTAFVQLDTDWMERLRGILELTRRLIDLATALLSLAVILVIGNTIRLEIGGRREEIEVVKLVGGSDGFVRRPFLYLGFLYGLLGGLMAGCLIALSLLLLGDPANSLAALYGSNYQISGLTLPETALLLGAGATLGWAGAGLAAVRHLRAFEPT